jgi:AcrR family transcriptional regulator
MSASKKNQLIENALLAFYRGGFHAIGMDKVAAESGVSKTAIYKHFRTKDELILATLQLRDKNFREWLAKRINALADTPQAKLMAIFDALHEWFKEPQYSGCMFVKASSEFMDRADPIHMASATHKRMLLDYFTELAKDAGARRPQSLAGQLLILKEGAIVMAHLDDPDQVANTAKTAAKTIIDAHF